jgi:putative transposase
MKDQHSIALLCATLEVCDSGYHLWLQARDSVRQQQDAALRPLVEDLHARHCQRYGAPRIQKALAQQGRHHGTKRIARLMKQAGLRGRSPKRYVPRTTDSGHDQPVAPNRLAQTATATGPNQIWVSDLTYVATQEGWLYVAVILDLWSRRVVGWSAGPRLQACLVVAALQMALRHRRPSRGLLHHSDRGVQYASAEHRKGVGS